MIDFCKYEIVKASRMKFRDLYFGNGTPESYRKAFQELWGHMDSLLCQYECDLAEMEAWYDEQEKKMEEERWMRVSLDRSDDLYDAQCESEIAERCENQG